MKNDTRGIIYALISATAFSLGGLLIKLMPWSALSIVSGRSIFSSLFIAGYFLVNKQKLIVNRTTIIGAILVVLNMVTYVLANKLTTAANTIILEYTAPIYIILYNLVILKQKPTRLKIFTVLFVLVGIVLVMASGIGMGNMLGNTIAAINGLIYGLTMLNNTFKGGDSVSSTLMGHIISFFVGLPSLTGESNFSCDVLLLVVLLGVVQAGLGYLMLALSVKYTDPLTTSLISYIEPILNPILVLLFYKETVSPLSILGIIIVMVSVLIYNLKLYAPKFNK